MTIKNLIINKKKAKKLASFVLAGTIATTNLSGCNLSVIDTTYSFNKIMITSSSSSILMNVKSWKDYQGEQLQIITYDDFVLLTSSFDTQCFSGNSDRYSAEIISKNISDEVYNLIDNENDPMFNKQIIDTQWTFNKAIVFNGNQALIIPISKWKDYEGEQLQVITPFGMPLLLSSFNTKLVYDEKSKMKAIDFAKMYVGKEGKITDLSQPLDETHFNYDIIDTQYSFNKALILKENTITIMSIDTWKDYEGEQLQLRINDGPEMLTAAYDTILINDQNSEIKAINIASALSSQVNDLSNDKSTGIFNKQIIDFDYGFSTSIFSNANASTAVKLKEWNDYEGEQLQIVLDTGDILLGTSLMLDLLNGGTNNINTSIISELYVGKNGKNIDEVNGQITTSGFNQTIVDFTKNSFKYALKISGENVTIIPLKSWKDYENPRETDNYIDIDGKLKSRIISGDSNNEQIQLILPEDTALLTSAYNTILVNNQRHIQAIAELFRGKNGTIIDLTSILGEPIDSFWNKIFIDTRYDFDSAIISNGEKNFIVEVAKWYDYADGEQLQITFDDFTDILTSYYNTTLVSSKTEGITGLLSNAFKGLEETKKVQKLVKPHENY